MKGKVKWKKQKQLKVGLPISDNEIVLFKLAIDFGELEKFEDYRERHKAKEE